MSPIRIALVDDAEELRLLVGLTLSLSGDFTVVGEAANGRDAISLAEAHRPDVMLLDLSMPEMDGLEALPRILAASPDTSVVVFSAFDEGTHGDEARRLGARGYVAKGTPLEDLADQIRGYAAEDAEGRTGGPLQSGA